MMGKGWEPGGEITSEMKGRECSVNDSLCCGFVVALLSFCVFSLSCVIQVSCIDGCYKIRFVMGGI